MIRHASQGDLDNLLSLGERMRTESTVHYPEIERGCAEGFLNASLEMPDRFLVAVAEEDGLVGMITAVAGPYAFSSEIRSASDLLYVSPEYRGGRTAMRLVQKYKDWSDEIGAVTSIMGISTGVTPEKTGRFFEFMGFSPIGMMYRRDNVYGT